jgi:hypothetical protein
MVEYLICIAQVEIAATSWATLEALGFVLWFEGMVTMLHAAEMGTSGA